MRKVFRRTEAGFTLIEMLIVVLLVGILAAVAAPLYLGYTKDAKTAEGKALVGSMWSSWQALAQQSCGTAQSINGAYPKAGLTSAGLTTPNRWDVSNTDTETLNMNCTNGAVTLSAPVVTTGTAADVSSIRIELNYDPTATPPVVLKCSSDSGTTYGPC